MAPLMAAAEYTDTKVGDSHICRHQQVGAGRSESTPMQTALPTFTPPREAVDAKRVVEVGSPGA
jgi:hypothetical protein